MEHVKVSTCQKCSGWVRRSPFEEMTKQDKIVFGLEAFHFNLKVNTISRQEYENDNQERCKCR